MLGRRAEGKKEIVDTVTRNGWSSGKENWEREIMNQKGKVLSSTILRSYYLMKRMNM